jgi:anti-sigma-K factor RskA
MIDDRTNDSGALSGAYALNALTPEERSAFEETLVSSDSVRHEVTELTDTAVLLGLAAAPVAPSAALKASIMDRIQSLPQLPALDSDERDAKLREPKTRDAAVTEGAGAAPVPSEPVTVASAPIAAPSPAAAAGAQTPAERTAQARWFSKPVVALASAAAVIGLIAGGGVIVNTLNESNSRQVMADRLAQINAAPDTQKAAAEVAGGGTATLVWSNELLASAIVVDGLKPLPADKVYELWYIGESGPRPAGTFTVGDDGATWRVLDGDMQAGDVVGVTVEPSGGSPEPTTDPIVALQSA